MPDSSQFEVVLTSNLVATIANGASLSDAIDLSGTILAGFIMPAAWTAADITLQASIDGTNFYDVWYPFGTEIKYTVTSSKFVTLTPADHAGVRYVKFRSGTSAAPVAQGAQRQITIVSGGWS